MSEFARPSGCMCPPVWNGILPPECPIHNPRPAGVTTTTGASLTIADQIRADAEAHTSYKTSCRTCAWLASLPAGERAGWVQAFHDRSLPVASITRVASRAGCPVGVMGIKAHCQGAH